MIVKQLALKNFTGYKTCSIDFSKRRTVLIAGANESGKSSILQAICYALYGRSRAEREVQLINSNTTGDMIVEAEILLHDGTPLAVTRGRTRKNEAIMKVGGFVGKPSDVAAQLESALRMSYNDFVSLSYFVQGDIHQFMTGNKREYFQRWSSGLEVWGEYEEMAHGEQLAVEKTIASVDARIAMLTDRIENSANATEDARAANIAYQRAKHRAEVAAERTHTLLGSLKSAVSTDAIVDTIDAVSEQLDSTQSLVRQLTKRVRDAKDAMRGVASGECPILHVACDELKAASKDRRKECVADIEELRAKLEDARKLETSTTARLRQLCNKRDKAPSTTIRKHLAAATDDLNTANKELELARSAQARTSVILENLVREKRDLGELVRKRKILLARLRHWQFVRYMCGKSGIPAELIERELERVEVKCNWVLSRLGYVKRIKFSGQKELAGMEKVCRACGGERWNKRGHCSYCRSVRQHRVKQEPTIRILDGHVERAFGMESGGAQVLESFAVRLACGLFVSSMVGVPMQMIMLDEIFAMLDTSNRQKLMALVANRLASEFGLSQQLIVSHQEDVFNSVDSVLAVTKERGNSTARWV